MRRMSAGLPRNQTSCNAPLFSILAEHGIGSVSQRKCLLKRFNTMFWSCTATTFGFYTVASQVLLDSHCVARGQRGGRGFAAKNCLTVLRKWENAAVKTSGIAAATISQMARGCEGMTGSEGWE